MEKITNPAKAEFCINGKTSPSIFQRTIYDFSPVNVLEKAL
jgi:hypothetical protein